MPSTIVDSAIFGNIFSTDAMRAVWSDENRTQKYLDIEAALARVQARLGIIPQEAADEIVKNCTIDKIDMAKLRQQTERIGYPVLGVVSQLNALCRDKLGEYCHWGATTQDITDTATVLQIREALAIVEDDLAAISAGLADLARRHRDTPMIGRSNLQQAVPVTFGYKMAGLLAAVERHRDRLDQLRPRVLVGEFAGAAGTLASLERGAMETQEGLMAELGLGQPVIAWHTVRDNIAEVGSFLGLVGGTLGKLSMDVKLMMQTEVGEVYEPYAHGRGSSSTMPQKRNPISSCYIHAGRAPARRRPDGRHGRRPRALDRPMGDRVDRPAGVLLPAGRIPETGPCRRERSGSRCRTDARQPRHDQRACHVRSGDDGPRPLSGPRIRP
jgi:3-carboxy-cis,cis-muconate cycloisomerase